MENNLTKENNIYINFDVLEKISLLFVYSECEYTFIHGEKSKHKESIENAINDVFQMSTEDGKTYYTLNERGYDKYRALVEKIANSNIKDKQLYMLFKSKKKCIAMYQKTRSKDIVIAFSGHYDTDDVAIQNFFGVKPSNVQLKKYEQIAENINATLATTISGVSRYGLVKGKEKVVVRFEPLHQKLKFLQNPDSVDYYSCCERKIFARLENDQECVYSGKLFVKYAPCEECTMSILYHIINKGKEFSMVVGLPSSNDIFDFQPISTS